jgi:threonine dehydrogenase-like Zn-dependent dehydrogenase
LKRYKKGTIVEETYKRAVFVEPRKIRFDEVPIPEPGPRQALVKVKACALCTWEQRSYTGEEPFYPLSSGHEVSGELVKVGSRVFTSAKIGDRVVASMLTRCGYCESCLRGMDNICDNNRKSFRDSDVVGPAGLAEYVLLEDYQLYPASNGVPYEELCLAEPLACVIRSVRKAAVGRADRVVVVGAGIMGILHLMLLKQAGATVFVSEPNGQRAGFAREMGADEIIEPSNDSFAEKVKALTDGRGADAILCAVSVGAVVEQAVEAVAKGGRVHVYASVHPRGTRISVDPNLFHSREIVLTGTMSQDRQDMYQAVNMISRGSIDLKPLISLRYPLLQLEEALQAALQPDTYRVTMLP